MTAAFWMERYEAALAELAKADRRSAEQEKIIAAQSEKLAACIPTQPPPIPNGHRPSWEVVIEDTKAMRDEYLARDRGSPMLRDAALIIYGALLDDMRARDRMGEKKYGVRLQPHNGRDPLRDAYEEALDACVYLANYDAESGHHNHHGLSRQAIRLAFSIRALLSGRGDA